MDKLADLAISLPVILGIALFIGIVVLARLLLSPNSIERRRLRQDRRCARGMPTLPFYDSERKLVTEERRNLSDRRKRAFMIITEHKRA
jgi:predicted nucleic acid-binding protein